MVRRLACLLGSDDIAPSRYVVSTLVSWYGWFVDLLVCLCIFLLPMYRFFP
jgi:hypothetical protein